MIALELRKELFYALNIRKGYFLWTSISWIFCISYFRQFSKLRASLSAFCAFLHPQVFHKCIKTRVSSANETSKYFIWHIYGLSHLTSSPGISPLFSMILKNASGISWMFSLEERVEDVRRLPMLFFFFFMESYIYLVRTNHDELWPPLKPSNLFVKHFLILWKTSGIFQTIKLGGRYPALYVCIYIRCIIHT